VVDAENTLAIRLKLIDTMLAIHITNRTIFTSENYISISRRAACGLKIRENIEVLSCLQIL
jgi:hypothetical protein